MSGDHHVGQPRCLFFKCLSVPPTRIRGFQARYYEKKLVFAIQPDPLFERQYSSRERANNDHEDKESDASGEPRPVGALSSTLLMDALVQLTEQMLAENEVFAEITGIS